MRLLAKMYFLVFVLFFISGCTVYTEKQSEAVSENVYATDDALHAARVDLAYQYSSLAKSFIKPPKHEIKIDSVYTSPILQTNNTIKKPLICQTRFPKYLKD